MGTSGSTSSLEWRRFWYLPVTAALGYSTALLHFYSLGPFFEPLQQNFGWSRAQISLGTTITGLAGAILSVPVGMLVDRFGPRRVALIGAPLMTGSVALLGTANGEFLNWLMLWGFVAIGNLCVQATVWTSAVASRFQRSRGLAFAITLSGSSVAATVFPILATWLIDSYGWRAGFAALGGIWAALVFPILFLFFRGAQDEGRNKNISAPIAPVTLTGMSVAAGLRSGAFRKLLLASVFFSFTALGVAVHLIPILKASGAAPLAAAGTASVVGVFAMGGQFGAGFLLDRYPGHLVGALLFLQPIVAGALLIFDGANAASQGVAAALFGLTVGSGGNVIASLAAAHFGLKNFGTLFGALVGALGFGTAFGPLVAGAAFDSYGSYAPFLVLTMVLAAANSVTLATLGNSRHRD